MAGGKLTDLHDLAGRPATSRLSFFPFSRKLASHLFLLRSSMSELDKFLAWWKDDAERCKCNLEQAIGAYISTFPGRLHALLVELLEKHR